MLPDPLSFFFKIVCYLEYAPHDKKFSLPPGAVVVPDLGCTQCMRYVAVPTHCPTLKLLTMFSLGPRLLYGW